MSDNHGINRQPVDPPVPVGADILFLAGRLWGRDEVARTGFPGIVVKYLGYAYVSFSFWLILIGYQNTRPFTFWTTFAALGSLIWATNVFVARNKRRDRDREILGELGITVERTEQPVDWLAWSRVKAGWDVPPAIMKLSRDNIPFLLINQALAGSVPTVQALGDDALSLPPPDVVPPVQLPFGARSDVPVIESSGSQSAGVSISGMIGTVGGSIIGGNQLNQIPSADLAAALHPLAAAIAAVPPEQQPEAKAKLSAIQQELAKGKHADDGILARLIDGLVGLLPSATTAVVSAFATPLLAGIAGPVTAYAVDKLRGK